MRSGLNQNREAVLSKNLVSVKTAWERKWFTRGFGSVSSFPRRSIHFVPEEERTRAREHGASGAGCRMKVSGDHRRAAHLL